ncbi:ABC transporter ATP-binding protein [bacterium]|nr:ABC transporter ATP-binding protein [bacterium]
MNDRAAEDQLVVEHVRKEFPAHGAPLVVLSDVSFALSPGDTVAVVGTSGTGKSTLLNIIGSLEPPTEGRVLLGGDEVAALHGAALAAFRSRRVGFVFQDHHLLPQCTALENVVLPTVAAGSPEGAIERAQALLERVGLAERMDSLPARLSGGEKQRVAIARALVNQPPLLLADEPTGNLDPGTSGTVAALFRELAEESGAMLIIVTHDLALAGQFGRCLELRDGVLQPRV